MPPGRMTRWHPIMLGMSIRKAADRFGGCDLILPRPEWLPAGKALALDEERDATPAERAVAEAIIASALPEDHGLTVQGVVVARLRRPISPGVERPGEVCDHLIPHLVTPRWASREPRTGGGHWLPAGRIEMVNEARLEPRAGGEGPAMPNTGNFSADLRAWADIRGWAPYPERHIASAIDVPVRTVQEWLQGRARPRPDGPIRKLSRFV